MYANPWEKILTELNNQRKSQTDLANFLGRSHSTIATWISRQTIPPTDVGLKIADFLGLDPYFIFLPEGKLEERMMSPIRMKFMRYLAGSSDESLRKLWDFFELMWTSSMRN